MANSSIIINPVDLQEAENFLVDYLTTKLAEEGITANFVRGGVERDIVIRSIAHLVAFMRGEAANIKNRLSFSLVNKLGLADEAANDVLEAIASNVFMDRSGGKTSTGPVELHFSVNEDVKIPKNTRFFYKGNLVFYINPNEDTILSRDKQLISLDTSGNIASYFSRVSFIAEKAGSDYDISPGNFVSTDSFSPFFLQATATEQFTGGKPKETNAELAERGKAEGLTARMISSSRAIKAFLQNKYPDDIKQIKIFGMGDYFSLFIHALGG